MRKKFLIPLLAVFTMTMVFTFSNGSNSSQGQEPSSIFVETDNIAFAEGGRCCIYYGWYCINGSSYGYNMKAC
jgi:hypothetical protein